MRTQAKQVIQGLTLGLGLFLVASTIVYWHEGLLRVVEVAVLGTLAALPTAYFINDMLTTDKGA